MTSSPRIPVAKISAVVSDVDGTLVTDDKILTARTEAAVADLHAHGIVFAIASSRPPRGLLTVRDRLKVTTPMAGFNGGVLSFAAATERFILGGDRSAAVAIVRVGASA